MGAKNKVGKGVKEGSKSSNLYNTKCKGDMHWIQAFCRR